MVDPLHDILQGLKTRLQDELDAQLQGLTRSHEQALEEARRTAAAEAEQQAAARVEGVNQEWTSRLESANRDWTARLEALDRQWDARVQEVEQDWKTRLESARETVNQEWSERLERELATMRGEAEKRLEAEGMRIRLEATQSAADTASRARVEFEAALAGERERAQQQIEAERERAGRELAEARAALDSERERAGRELADAQAVLTDAQAALENERRRAEDAIGEARVRAEEAMAERSRAEATIAEERARAEAAIGIERARAEAAIRDERTRAEAALEEARTRPTPVQAAVGTRLLEAISRLDDARSLTDVLSTTAAAAAAEAPRVALFIVNTNRLEPWRIDGASSIAAGSIRADGREAGVLGDAIREHHPVTTSEGQAEAPAFASLPPGRAGCAVPFVLGGQPVAVLYADEGPAGAAPPAWQDAIQVLGRHASACLAHLTAQRTAQAMRLVSGTPGSQAVPNGNGNDDEQGARRYARLLVSEIKLYNESAVRLGRQKRDLLQRLRPEIDRARRIYAERVPSSVHSRDAYFQQELVQTLADGDPALLG